MASLLETFVLKFTTDSSELNQGANSARKTTEDLNKTLAQSTKKSTEASNGLVGLIRQYGGFITSALSLAAVLRSVNDAANYNDQLNDLSNLLGIDISQLDAWGAAVKTQGGSVEAFQGTIKSLTQSLQEFTVTGYGDIFPFFQSLGIQLTDVNGKARDVFELLPELAKVFETLSPERAFVIGRGLGLDDGTIRLLQRGSSEVDRIIARQKELGTVTKADAIIAQQYNDAWDDTTRAFRSLSTEVGSAVLPTFTHVLKGIQDIVGVIKDNEQPIKVVFTAIAGLLLARVIPALVATAAASIAAFAPFYAAAAAVLALATALGFIQQDIDKFNRGEESVTGTLINPSNDKTESYLENHSGNAIGFGLSPQQQLAAGFRAFEDPRNNTQVYDILLKGRQALSFAETSPLASQTSNTISNSTNNNRSTSTAVNVSNLTVNTQATNAEELAAGFHGALETQIQQAASQYDDGRLA